MSQTVPGPRVPPARTSERLPPPPFRARATVPLRPAQAALVLARELVQGPSAMRVFGVKAELGRLAQIPADTPLPAEPQASSVRPR